VARTRQDRPRRVTPVVLDTDVASFLFKNDTRAQTYLQHLQNRQWLISFMTEAELEQWALLSNWQARRVEWLRNFLGRFAIVLSSHDLVLKWAEAMGGARRAGRRLESADAWIAATAVLYDAPLITHNPSDYLGVPGLGVITETP
jgi:tRNA(fMet)-specific endonuclease VapC